MLQVLLDVLPAANSPEARDQPHCSVRFDHSAPRLGCWLLSEDLVNLSRHYVDVGHPVDPAQNAAIAVIGQDRCGLPVVDLEAGFDRLRSIVRTADEFGAAASAA